MRETPKAKQAFNDYLAMGADRSFDKLLDKYLACPESAPTNHRTQIKRWSIAHGWQPRLVQIAEIERAAIVARGIADKQNRVDALNDRWDRMQIVIRERGEDIAMEGIAGGRTGLLVHRQKMIGTSRNAVLTDEYEVDTGLLKELREHEKQAAQELGQWVEKTEDNGQRQITVEYVNDWRGTKGNPAGPPSGPADGTEASEAV